MRSFRYNSLVWLLPLLLLCCKKVERSDISHLEGNWEILEVRFPDGGSREYVANTTIEYYELIPDSSRGFRKKLQPQLDGRFRTSDDALPMEWLFRDNRLFLRFEGEPEAWEEEVLELTAERLVTRHSNGLTYIYGRYIPINLESDGTTR